MCPQPSNAMHQGDLKWPIHVDFLPMLRNFVPSMYLRTLMRRLWITTKLPSPSNATQPHRVIRLGVGTLGKLMTRTPPVAAAATAPNRPGNLWRRDRMQAAFLSGYFTAHWPPKHNNITESITHRRLHVSKLCRNLASKWEANAVLCAAETRMRDGRGPKTACSCHWLLRNAHRSQGRAANIDASARTSRRCCN